jgi:rod shape determining protein RodA
MAASINRKRIFISSNLWIFVPLILLSVIGLVTLFSTKVLPEGGFGDLGIVYKQIVALVIGWIGYILFLKIDISYLKYWQVLLAIFVFSVLLLLIPLIFGPEINGVRRWIVIGDFQIQPSEVAKLSVILITAGIFSMRDKYNEWLLLFISLLFVLVIFLLVYFEPGGSMSLLILSSWFLISFLALSNPIRNTFLLVIIGSMSLGILLPSITGDNGYYILLLLGTIITIFALYSKQTAKIFIIISFLLSIFLGGGVSLIWRGVLKEYQKDRIIAFFNPEETASNIGFNVNQSKIAIGSGRIFGKGFGNGTQSKRNFVPEHETDFIFASFAEEFGLVGSVFLLFLYGSIIISCFLIGINTPEDKFSSLLALGVGGQILLVLFVNVGTNLGAIPATGIPLPLLSSGGTVTMLTLFSLGFVQNVYRRYVGDTKNRSHQIIDTYEIS